MRGLLVLVLGFGLVSLVSAQYWNGYRWVRDSVEPKVEAISNPVILRPVASPIGANSNSTPKTDVEKEVRSLLNGHRVTLFSKTYCPYSKGLKRILAPYKINDLHIVEVNLHPFPTLVQDELQRHSHIHTVPQLFVNGRFVGNFDTMNQMEKRREIRDLLAAAGALDEPPKH